ASARCLMYVGRTDEARLPSERALSGFTELAVTPLMYMLASGLGIIHLHLGELAPALKYAQQACELAASPQQQADGLCLRGFINDLSGDHPAARTDFDQCVARGGPSTQPPAPSWG